jgi:nucleoside-triphosphatase
VNLLKNILVTGSPGCGKTTLACRVAEALGDRAGGFVTEEVRERGTRTGFGIRTLAGERGILADVRRGSGPRVGKYRVCLPDLERVAVPALRSATAAGGIVVIDEIGKMELFSAAFREAVLEALDSAARVLATIHARREPFGDRIRARDDVSLLALTRENRDRLTEEVLAVLSV